MGKKIIGDGIAPKCIYCKHGIPTPDGKMVLCTKLGVLDKDYSCSKFTYDALKRKPRALPELEKFNADDFIL